MDTATPERPRELFRVKQGHVYQITYRKGQESRVADVLAKWAAHDGIPMTWGDASDWGDDLDDGTGAAKGIVLGVGLGVAFWLGVGLAIREVL